MPGRAAASRSDPAAPAPSRRPASPARRPEARHRSSAARRRRAATAGAPGLAPSRGFGFGSGLAAGLLGAGLFGLLGGHGFGLLPLLLIGGLIWFALRALRSRPAGFAGGPTLRTGFGGPVGGSGSGPAARPGTTPLAVTPADFDAFESLLVDIQTAYGREDAPALGRLTTPEVFRIFDTDLRANAARGVHNDITDPRLLQGDLAEAWREGATDYATVAMRFSLRDVTVERGSGRVVGGDPARPTESTEVWTFRRERGGPWLLSAIQQGR